MPIEIRIFKEEDRNKVAAILVNNGYKVWQGKKPRPGTKSVDYLLYVEDAREGKE